MWIMAIAVYGYTFITVPPFRSEDKCNSAVASVQKQDPTVIVRCIKLEQK